MTEYLIALNVFIMLLAAYQKGRADGLKKDALPLYELQFKRLEILYDNERKRNYPELPESSGGSDGR